MKGQDWGNWKAPGALGTCEVCRLGARLIRVFDV